MSGTTAVVGALGHSMGQGAAYVFTANCTPLTSCPASDNCGTIPDGCGGTVDCGTCGAGQVCSGNVCVSSTTSSSSRSSSGTGGSGTGGMETGATGSGAGGTTGNPGQNGCQCEAAGAPAETPGASLSALGLLAFAGVMRSRRRRGGAPSSS